MLFVPVGRYADAGCWFVYQPENSADSCSFRRSRMFSGCIRLIIEEARKREALGILSFTWVTLLVSTVPEIRLNGKKFICVQHRKHQFKNWASRSAKDKLEFYIDDGNRPTHFYRRQNVALETRQRLYVWPRNIPCDFVMLCDVMFFSMCAIHATQSLF